MVSRPTHVRQFIATGWRTVLLNVLVVLLAPSCANTGYRFERIDGVESIAMPLKLTGVDGLRDGASVRAEIRFADGADSGRMTILVELVPPPEFKSGSYQLILNGQTIEGRVDCTSLNYLGGQNDRPSIGGVFVLRDSQNRPAYRVRFPATVMARK